MSELIVTSSEVRRKAAELQRLNLRMRGKIGELERWESALNGMWDGQANTAFHARFVRDKARMERFCQAVERYIRTLGNVAASYEAAERRNLAMIQAGR